MGKKQSRFVVLDLGRNSSVDTLLREDQCTFALEVHREDLGKPYGRYYVERVIPCKFEKGKLYKV